MKKKGKHATGLKKSNVFFLLSLPILPNGTFIHISHIFDVNCARNFYERNVRATFGELAHRSCGYSSQDSERAEYVLR